MASPVVTAFNKNLLLGNTALPAELFVASDPDGDPIQFYQLLDNNSTVSSGFFRLSGTELAAGLWHTIAAADLANLVFVAGTNIQSDPFQIRVFDGNSWSLISAATVFTVQANTTAPVVTLNDFTVVGNEKIRVSSLFTAFDPDGYPIQRYRFYDRLAVIGGGYFELNGAPQQQRQWITVNASDLPNLYYVAASSQETELIDMAVYDGAAWSARDYAYASTRHNANRPVVFIAEYTQEAQVVSSIATLFNWTDEDGNTIKTYRFYDRDASANSGFLSINGIKQSALQWIDVPAAELGNVSWTSAVDTRVEQFMVQVFDGRYKSVPVPITIESFKQPGLGGTPGVISSGGITVLREDQAVNLASLFTGVGTGSGFGRFQVVDTNSHETSAKLYLDGIQLSAGAVIDLSAAQFSRLQVRGGSFEQRNLDDIIVRGNKFVWSPWTHAIFRTEPEYDTALDAGVFWGDFVASPPGPRQITYSFMQDLPPYETGAAPADGFVRFSNAQRTAVRQIFRLMERFANVTFIEVNDSQTTSTGQGGMIRFGDFIAPDLAMYGFSFLPDDPAAAPEGGDIWVNVAVQDSADVAPGTGAWTDLARLIAGAIGLKGAGGNPGLPGATANLSYAVAGHLAGGASLLFAPGGRQPKNYMLYDVATIQKVYGANTNYASGNNLYDFAGYWNNDALLFDMIWDTGGTDRLDFSNTGFGNSIDLRPGSVNNVVGGARNLVISFGTLIEHVTSGSGNDFLYGNETVNEMRAGSGDDFITSGGGVDFMFGEAGNDIYEWRAGDGSDVLNELGGGGLDELRLGYVPGMTEKSDFTELRFRRSGNDVIVDLRVDETTEAELTIVQQMFGLYRIETLNFAGTRVDFTSIDSLLSATGTPSSFAITDTQSPTGFGFLAAPI